MKRVPNAMLLKSSISWCSGWQRSTRRSLLLQISMALMPILWLTGCSGGVLEPQGPIGAANLKIMYNALAIMLVIVLPTILATLAFAWWFRASNARALYRPDWVYSGRIELLVWGIPLLMFLGGVIWMARTTSTPLSRSSPRASRPKCRWSRSIGNGCSSTPIRESPARSGSWPISTITCCRCIK
jgi:hypothetical protein